jgi:hypothetical protein
MDEAEQLLANLRSRRMRNRVGLWLIPTGQIGQAADAAARLGVDAQDLREVLLDRLPADTRFAGLSSEKLIDLLDTMCEQPGSSDSVMVYNLDLLLAGLEYESQQDIWRTLWQGFPHRQRALLLVMPNTASHLLPKPFDLEAWRREGRLAGALDSLGA